MLKSSRAFLLAAFLAAALHAEAQLGANLVQNGSAETNTGPDDDVADFAGWTRTGNVTADTYAVHPVIFDPAPPSNLGDHWFFAGTPPDGSQNDVTTLAQSVNVAFATSIVDTGKATYDLSAWFMVRDQNADPSVAEDRVSLRLSFLGASAQSLGTAALGPFDGSRYANNPAVFDQDVSFFGEQTGFVPSGTRSIVVTQRYVRFLGVTTNTGMDLVSLKINPVPEPATVAALGLGAVIAVRRRKRLPSSAHRSRR